MGVGSQKKPIVTKFSDNVACGVRLGGMGVAIGSHVGMELAGLAELKSGARTEWGFSLWFCGEPSNLVFCKTRTLWNLFIYSLPYC